MPCKHRLHPSVHVNHCRSTLMAGGDSLKFKKVSCHMEGFESSFLYHIPPKLLCPKLNSHLQVPTLKLRSPRVVPSLFFNKYHGLEIFKLSLCRSRKRLAGSRSSEMFIVTICPFLFITFSKPPPSCSGAFTLRWNCH